VKRVVAVALAAVPLLAVATPAAAAPVQHLVQSSCSDDGENTICYKVDLRSKTTTTPSGNKIIWSRGTVSTTITLDSNGWQSSDSWSINSRWVITRGKEQVARLRYSSTWSAGDLYCIGTSYLKATNGKVQLVGFVGGRNFEE
jgi:hypothetical protein